MAREELASTSVAPVLTVTGAARSMVLEVRSQEPDAAELALWLEVGGVSESGYTYDMYFQALADASADDVVEGDADLRVVIPASSVSKLRGATLDVSSSDGDGGMVIINPNRPPAPTSSAPRGDLSGEVAQQVLAVLDQQVNPSIAAHGGRADLVAVEDSTAYLRLSGGCQGCGMAIATLKQGIEVAIIESVPEISSVVDVTDHASGTNPYFEPS